MRSASIFSATVAATFFVAAPAAADVSSFFSLGTGYSTHASPSLGAGRAIPLSFALGVASTPRASFVLGGVLRSTTFFSLGTDLSFSLRGATGGFARGDWGLALDAGAVGRYWAGGAYGRYPLQAILTGGAPWGLQIALGSTFGSLSGEQTAKGFFGLLEVDLLRLTLMRQGSTDGAWRNPMPAGGRIE